MRHRRFSKADLYQFSEFGGDFAKIRAIRQ